MGRRQTPCHCSKGNLGCLLLHRTTGACGCNLGTAHQSSGCTCGHSHTSPYISRCPQIPFLPMSALKRRIPLATTIPTCAFTALCSWEDTMVRPESVTFIIHLVRLGIILIPFPPAVFLSHLSGKPPSIGSPDNPANSVLTLALTNSC